MAQKTKEDVKNELKSFYMKNGRMPELSDYYKKKMPISCTTIRRIYGTFTAAFLDTFGVNPEPKRKIRVVKCLTCNKNTKNPKFCSSSCAASFNNSNDNGRKVGCKKYYQGPDFLRLCPTCKCEISARRMFCDKCFGASVKTFDGDYVNIENATKKMLLTDDTQRYSRIRKMARKVLIESGIEKVCKICSYSKRVDCCHIKPINEYEDSTLVTVINDIANLVWLCPNHHWEFDNKLVDINGLNFQGVFGEA